MVQTKNLIQSSDLVAKLSLRLEQAWRISEAAAVCLTEEDNARALNLLENAEELVRDASHLVAAALVMRYPEEPSERKDAETMPQSAIQNASRPIRPIEVRAFVSTGGR